MINLLINFLESRSFDRTKRLKLKFVTENEQY